ncbi:MAG: hypothetical protein Q8Q09_22805 [Deltaproteobacteria bacterium]|nr:hypothetical protein [Deltaproteobacteria bacterium]
MRRTTSTLWASCALSLALLAGCQNRQHEEWTRVAPAGETTRDIAPEQPDDVVVGPGVVSSENSLSGIAMALWIPAVILLAIAFALRRGHKQRAALEKTWLNRTVLANGPAVIEGVVELAPGEEAMSVTFMQRRQEVKQKGGGVIITWIEKSREVRANPFRVKLDDGQYVLVQPDTHTVLRDAVDEKKYLDNQTRSRAARLTQGERVWVTGMLSGAMDGNQAAAYRQHGVIPTLRGDRTIAMMVSTEPPATSATARANHHMRWIRGALWTVFLLQVLVCWDFTLLGLTGTGVDRIVTETGTWLVWVKPKNQPGRWVRHYGVAGAETLGGESEQFETSREFYQCAAQGLCRTLPTQRTLVPGLNVEQVGRGPTLHTGQMVIAGLTGWILLLSYTIATRSSRAWYAGGKLIENGQ